MSLLDKLFGNDHERAAQKYPDHESASDKASRKRRQNHQRHGAQRAAQQGQNWEDDDRRRRGTSFWTW